MLRRAKQKRKTLKNVFLEKGREESDSKGVPKEKKKERKKKDTLLLSLRRRRREEEEEEEEEEEGWLYPRRDPKNTTREKKKTTKKKKKKKKTKKNRNKNGQDGKISRIVEMGFTVKQARGALQKSGWKVEVAVSKLLQT